MASLVQPRLRPWLIGVARLHCLGCLHLPGVHAVLGMWHDMKSNPLAASAPLDGVSRHSALAVRAADANCHGSMTRTFMVDQQPVSGSSILSSLHCTSWTRSVMPLSA